MPLIEESGDAVVMAAPLADRAELGLPDAPHPAVIRARTKTAAGGVKRRAWFMRMFLVSKGEGRKARRGNGAIAPLRGALYVRHTPRTCGGGHGGARASRTASQHRRPDVSCRALPR